MLGANLRALADKRAPPDSIVLREDIEALVRNARLIECGLEANHARLILRGRRVLGRKRHERGQQILHRGPLVVDRAHHGSDLSVG